MTSIADDLDLAQSPIEEDDLIVHILSQLGEEYNAIAAAIKVREQSISYPELFDKILDFERSLKEATPVIDTIVPTVNYIARKGGRPQNSNSSQRNQRSFNSGPQRQHGNNRPNWFTNSTDSRQNRNGSFCQFCSIRGHTTQECRELSKFLKDNNITIANSPTSNLVANVTTSAGSYTVPPTWLFDTGASHYVTSDRSALHNVSEYGGPDEIFLGDGNGLHISHTGSKHIHTTHRQLTFPSVLCAPRLRRNLVSVAKLCKTNHVSFEFFPDYYFVKDL